MVEIYSRLAEAGRRKVTFSYRVERKGTVLAEGESVHIVTGTDGRAHAMPDDLLRFISQALP
jgi:acyl-CoA thioesterase FadM